MYIRFVIPEWDAACRAELGIFHGVFRALHRPSDSPDWLREELRREYDWFNAQLAIPEALHLRAGRHSWRPGICWFRPEAREHIARARYMAWLLRELGQPVREIRARRPGTVFWRDPHQVVVAAEAVPRAFA